MGYRKPLTRRQKLTKKLKSRKPRYIGGNDNKCPICLEKFTESEIDGNQTIQCNECGQNFHDNCIREWCESEIEKGCPLCRNTAICTNNNFNLPQPKKKSMTNIVANLGAEHSGLGIIQQDELIEKAQWINSLDTYEFRREILNQLKDYITIEESSPEYLRNSPGQQDASEESTIRLNNAKIFQEEVTSNFEWFTTPRSEDSLDIQHLTDMYTLMTNIHNEYTQLQELPETSIWQRIFSRQQRNIHKQRKTIFLKLRNFQRNIFAFGLILIKRDNLTDSDAVIGGTKSHTDFVSSTSIDHNEAANVLAGIANINDENTEDLERRVSYFKNLDTSTNNSLKIALLIQVLKNYVVDENEKNQIIAKQNQLWQNLKKIPLEDDKRRDILFKYMLEYLTRIIDIDKLNDGAKIVEKIMTESLTKESLRMVGLI